MHTFCHREENTFEHNILGKGDRIQKIRFQLEGIKNFYLVTMRVTEHENNKFSLCLLNVSLFRSLNSACVFHFAGKKQRV